MLEFFSETGFGVLANLLQIAVSSVLALLAYCAAKGRVKGGAVDNSYTAYIVIAAASTLGIILPLDTFAILPLLFVLIKLGFSAETALPMIFSNMVFNMLVPFNDPSFIWRTGFLRMLAAFVIGAAAGILLKSLAKKHDIIKLNPLPSMPEQPFSFSSALKNLHRNISFAGLYLIVGVLFNTIFDKYIIYNVTSEAFTNPHTSFLPNLFARYDVVNPLFLLAIAITYSLLNFTNLSAVLAVLKPKSFALYVSYFIVWVILLGCTMFF